MRGKDCIEIIIVSLVGLQHGDCQDTCRNNNYSIFD